MIQPFYAMEMLREANNLEKKGNDIIDLYRHVYKLLTLLSKNKFLNLNNT